MIAILASGAINLLPDKTFFIQLGIFFFVVVVLRAYVIGPILTVLKKRQDMGEGARRLAAELSARAKTADDEMEARLAAVRHAAMSHEEALRHAAEEKTKAIIADVRAKEAERFSATEQELAVKRKTAEATLAGQRKELAALILQKIIPGHQERK